ncbi:hypothetical protein MRX96_029336 [Rhipicephalus microplus]
MSAYSAGLQKRWGKKKQGDKARSEGAEDVAPLESKEELPAAGSAHTLFSAYSSQNTDARGLEHAGPSTSVVGSDRFQVSADAGLFCPSVPRRRSGQFMSYQGIPDSDSQFSGSSASHRSRSQHPVGRSRSAHSAQRRAPSADDRVEETVWEYKALILDRDNKPQGPKTWVSKPTSLIKVKEGDPDAQYEACEFANRSSHHVAFRITKANGLQFNPDHGVLKPNERVPLKFKVRPSTRPPGQSEVEILAMRVNPTSSGKMIEDKWRLMPTNKVSRVGHTVQLRAPEKTRQRPLLTPPPTPCATPTDRITRRLDDRKEDADRPAAPVAGWPERWKSLAQPQSKHVSSDPVTPAVGGAKETKRSFKVLHVTVAVLALAVFALIVQVCSLWVRVNNIGENFCDRHYCIWFFCR